MTPGIRGWIVLAGLVVLAAVSGYSAGGIKSNAAGMTAWQSAR